jgi:hypothetical protein
VGNCPCFSSPSSPRYCDPAKDPTKRASPAVPMVRVPNVDSTISSGSDGSTLKVEDGPPLLYT